MRMRPEEISGLALNYAVAIAHEIEVAVGKTNEGKSFTVLADNNGVWKKFDPQSNPALVERIAQANSITASQSNDGWIATCSSPWIKVFGQNREEAVLRCLVKVHRDDVEIPNELLSHPAMGEAQSEDQTEYNEQPVPGA